jgi:hypothetical protein
MIAIDKQLHFLVGAVVLFTFATFGNAMLGLIVACILGLGKEVHDYCRPNTNTAELADIMYTVAGAAVAFGLVWVAALTEVL